MADAHLTAGVTTAPKKVGLYDPANEKDACGIGFIADLTRTPTRSTVVVRAPSAPAPLPQRPPPPPSRRAGHVPASHIKHLNRLSCRSPRCRARSELLGSQVCGVGSPNALRQDALEMLSRMEHRGACGCEIDTGDGAGAIFTLPHDFLKRVVKEDCGVEVSPQGHAQLSWLFLCLGRHSAAELTTHARARAASGQRRVR